MAIDRKVHRAAIEIAIGRVLVGQLRHAHLDPNGVHIRVGDGAHHRLARLDLYSDDHLVLNGREAGHIALLLAAVTGLQGDAREVGRSIRVLNGRVVQVNRLQAVDQPLDLTLGNEVNHSRIGFGTKAVGGLLGHTGASSTAFAATARSNDQLAHAAISSTSMPALITAEPTINRP